MVETMGKKMKKSDVHKLDVSFNISQLNMSTLIGRTAHILFLVDEIFMKIILSRYEFLTK